MILESEDARPDYVSWTQVSVGSGGKILHSQGLMPSKTIKFKRDLIPIKMAIEDLNKRGGVTAPIDDYRWDDDLGHASETKANLPKPKIKKRTITEVELAYQIRSTKNGQHYVGRVYILRLTPDQEGDSNSVTIPASKP